MSPRSLPSARILLALAVAVLVIAAAAWWGWEGAEDARLERERASASAMDRSARRPLVLVEPPVVIRKNLEPTLPPKPVNATGTPPPRKAVAGGAKSDPLVDMWEAAYLRPPVTSGEPLTPPRWVIVGVANRGDQQIVMVQRGSDPTPHYYKVGDTLPGGARIVWVKPGVVGLATPRRERIELSLDH